MSQIPQPLSDLILWKQTLSLNTIKGHLNTILPLSFEWLMWLGWKTIIYFLSWYQAYVLNMKSICKELFELLCHIKMLTDISKILITSQWLVQLGWKSIGVFLSLYKAYDLNLKPICQEFYELSGDIKSVDRRTDNVITKRLLQCRALISKSL